MLLTGSSPSLVSRSFCSDNFQDEVDFFPDRLGVLLEFIGPVKVKGKATAYDQV